MEYKQNELFRDLKIINFINSIYIESTREYTSNTDLKKIVSSNNIRLLESLESLIDKNFYKEKFPKFYAGELNITTKHLNRIVKETINETTSQLISERIILEAKRLIVHSKSNFAAVANTLGFSDYAYFSKFFKLKTGLTPMNFRKKY